MNFDNLRNFGSSLNNTSTRLYGIGLAYQDEIDTFFSNKLGFSLFGKNDKRCKINDIKLEWTQVINDNRSGTVKTHSLEDRDNTLISSNMTNGNRKYGLKVILTNIGTKNKEQIYDEILELWQKKKLCTISTIETIEDMVITSVTREYTNSNILEFNMDFEVLEFAYLLSKGETAEENGTLLNQEQRTGVAGTTESAAEWGGFL